MPITALIGVRISCDILAKKLLFACEASSEHVFLNREGRFVRMKREMPEFCEAIESSMNTATGKEQES